MPGTIPARITEHQVVHYLRYELAFNTPGATAGVQIGTLPAGAQVVDITVNVKTAFNAGTTNPVTIGTTATGEEIGTSAAVIAGTIGGKRLTTGLNVQPASDQPVYVSYIPTGTAATTGLMTVYVGFIPNL